MCKTLDDTFISILLSLRMETFPKHFWKISKGDCEDILHKNVTIETLWYFDVILNISNERKSRLFCVVYVNFHEWPWVSKKLKCSRGS